ncbi:FtsX-like permease family protein [Actinoplanes sp. GCM10030250]|uniref:FtsX-like permease family protein n=1 Tax=Actinoplanes sp. GCM10030250 TaxID=3273376 RepID=UPI00360FD776
MISLVLAMVWTRRGQAVTLALLAMLAVSCAVAAPAYLIAAERATADGQIATASTSELSLVARRSHDIREEPPGSGGPIKFPDVGRVLLNLDGFTYYHSAEVSTIGLEKTNLYPSHLVFRQEICAHVQIVAGRCVAAEGDVLLGEKTAERLGLAAGDPIVMRAARQDDTSQPIIWYPDAPAKTFTVAGTYRPIDPTGAYWGLHGYFVAGPDIGAGEPVFTNAVTLDTMSRTVTVMAIDGVARPGTLDIDRLDELRADLAELNRTASQIEGSLIFDSGIPRLLDRIDEGRAAARLLVPVVAVPLVLLACFTIYLTVGYGAQGRQSELAVVALRGARWWTRWWLATGESLTAVLAGAVVGCLTGQLLVNVVTAVLFPGVGADPAFTSLEYAPVAAIAALVAAVVAQRRQLVSPVAGLLRRAPAADRRRLAATEAVVAVLAVVAGVQFALSDGELTGIGLFAPALLILALALLTARALLPLVNTYAGRALRRGRLGVALAGMQLSRRPGAGQLFALLVAAAAVAGYSASAVDTAAGGRGVQAHLGTGADRVLTVESTTRQRLLDVVRAVDPQKAFAMAVVTLPGGGTSTVPGLAVDTERLAAVAAWPAGAPAPAEVNRLLHPPAPEPVKFAGEEISVEADSSARSLRLAVSLTSTSGLGNAIVELGDLRQGVHTYREDVPMCERGCRLNGIRISGAGTAADITGRVVIRELNTAAPAPLTDPARWRGSEQVRLSAAAEGLQADVTVSASVAESGWIQPVTSPVPVPMAWAGKVPLDGAINGLSFDSVPAAAAAEMPAIPGLGRQSIMIDLEYADLLAVDVKQVSEPQVWLSAAAPADAVERLQAQGLRVVSDVSAAQVRENLDRQGPAVALWFYLLSAGLAVLLGAGALALTVAVDRVRRTEDLTALRNQGLRSRPAGQATLWTYPVLVAIATVVGLLVAMAVWWMTGWALPLAGLAPPDLPLPVWPRVSVVCAAGGVVLAVQLFVAVLGGRDLRRRVESRRVPNGSDPNGRASNGRASNGRGSDGRGSDDRGLNGRGSDGRSGGNGRVGQSLGGDGRGGGGRGGGGRDAHDRVEDRGTGTDER